MMTIKKLIYSGLITMTLNAPSQANEATKKLPMCPNSPNCVSSQAANAEHFIAPFKIKGKPEEAWVALRQALAGLERTAITEANGDELHAESTSLVFRFVDDINAILDADAKLIHIRSASRVGYSDLGVNRKRVESLRLRLQQVGVIE
jgi:uncharacterized protein (DUF1499 family)